MKHLKYFPDAAAIGSGIEVDLPNVSYLEGKNVLYVPGENSTATIKVDGSGNIEAETTPDYSQMYLTFEAIESGTFSFSASPKITSGNLYYSTDNGITWVNLSYNTNTLTITAGNIIIWKGNLTSDGIGIGCFVTTGNFNAYGNVMSLLYGDNFIGQTDLIGKDYVFYQLFYNTKINNAQNLVLPATTLADSCYYMMFWGCTNLVTQAIVPNIVKPVQAIYCSGMYVDTQVPINTNDYNYAAWRQSG